MLHMKKERLVKGKYTKSQMQNIGPRTVFHKFEANTHEIELPPRVASSPIFDVVDLYPFKGSVLVGEEAGALGILDEDWGKDLPPSEPLKLECILDSKEFKRTRHQVYHEHLVKWKGFPNEDATGMTKGDIKKHGTVTQDLILEGT